MGRKTTKDPVLLKKELLARLAQGYGVTESCKILRVSRSTFYNWKNSDEAFASEVDRIMSDPIHQTRILMGQSKAEVPTHADWQLRFIGVYRKTGDRDQAASAAGKEPTFVNNALDSRHEDFDEAFHKMFSEEEQRRLWRIEDRTLTKAEHDMPTARFVLSNLLKEKYGKIEGGGTTQNLFWFSTAGEDRAMSTLNKLFGHKEVVEIAAQSTS